jgi:hypothetical protein
MAYPNLEMPYSIADSVSKSFWPFPLKFWALEVSGPAQVPGRGVSPIGKYCFVCANEPLRQNRDTGLRFEMVLLNF